MHELSTNAAIPPTLVGEVLKILQGLCGMTPVRQLERRLIFQGPKAPPLLGIGTSQMQGRNQANIRLWKELHEQLIRQSYYLTIYYEIDEAEFGKLVSNRDDREPIRSLDDLRGTLQFFDNPDPPGTRSVNSRLAIQINDESHLPSFLGQVNYSYSSEHIREAHYAYRDSVMFCLSRDLRWPKQADEALASDSSHMTQVDLPPFEDFEPFDAENKWALTVSAQVSDGNQPTLMQRGLEQLAQVKLDFAGIIEFIMTPRRQLDTRVQSYNQSMRI